MKRFIRTDFIQALNESVDNPSLDWEQLYEEFTDVLMNNALKMDHTAYCCALNRVCVELRFLKGKVTDGTKKNLLSGKIHHAG
jgi:hypothetical protein